MPTLNEVAQLIHVELNPPVEVIAALLERYEQGMALANEVGPMTLPQRMERFARLAGDDTEQRIVTWLLCHIPAHLLKEAAAKAVDDWSIKDWEE